MRLCEVVKEIISYQTVDGKLFTNKEEAEKHEKIVNNRKVYRINYCPDLTEGRGLQKSGYIVVEGDKSAYLADLLVENWCYVKWGNKVAFAQGVCPTPNWKFTNVENPIPKIQPDKILAVL